MANATWAKSAHPRAHGGKFARKGGGAGVRKASAPRPAASAKPAKPAPPPTAAASALASAADAGAHLLNGRPVESYTIRMASNGSMSISVKGESSKVSSSTRATGKKKKAAPKKASASAAAKAKTAAFVKKFG